MIQLELYQDQIRAFEEVLRKEEVPPEQVQMVQIPYVDLLEFINAVTEAKAIIEDQLETPGEPWLAKYFPDRETAI